MITTVLFDLDGTLLSMDTEGFTKYYFGLLTKKLEPYGFEPKELVSSVWTGIEAMVRNDGSVTNEVAFWDKFTSVMGSKAREYEYLFEEFYKVEFNNAQVVTGKDDKLVKLVHYLKGRGIRVILATNPVFPYIATENRIKWAGLEPEDFELITTYENTSFCKPNILYYEDIVKRAGLIAEECIMIGNDVSEDMPAKELGMKVFLLTRDLLNKHNKDISVYPNGGTDDLVKMLEKEMGISISL